MTVTKKTNMNIDNGRPYFVRASVTAFCYTDFANLQLCLLAHRKDFGVWFVLREYIEDG